MNLTLLISFLLAFTVANHAMENELSIPQTQMPSLAAFLIDAFNRTHEETSVIERHMHKFHGIKIPIHRYSLENNTGSESTACILRNAKPALWFGVWYDEKAPATDRIFLDGRNSHYQAEIKKRANHYEIRGSCMVGATGILAILWKDVPTGQLNLTMADIAHMQRACDTFDLDQDKKTITIYKTV